MASVPRGLSDFLHRYIPEIEEMFEFLPYTGTRSISLCARCVTIQNVEASASPRSRFAGLPSF